MYGYTITSEGQRSKFADLIYSYKWKIIDWDDNPKTNKNFAEDLLIKIFAEYNSPRNRTEY